MSDAILVVDDDTDLQTLLEFTFESEGFEVVTREDGAAALSYLRSEEPTPACMVLDIVMPGLGGMDVLEARAESKELAAIPTIVLTGRDADDVVEEAFELGADDFVAKPFNQNELVARVRRLLG